MFSPPDKSKHLSLIHVLYKNYGIIASNVWVPTINQLCKKFKPWRAICENFFQKSISMRDVSDFRGNFAKTKTKFFKKVANRRHRNFRRKLGALKVNFCIK